MRLKRYISILLVGLGIAIATGFATIFATAFTTIWGSSSVAINTCDYHEAVYDGLELPQLAQELRGSGLIGRIHGSVPSANMLVLSVRDPDDFFSHQEFSLLTRDSGVQATLKQLHRHDQVCVQGRVLDNPSPQKHVLVQSITVLEPWTGLEDYPDYHYEVGVPDELKQQTQVVGKVHAIGAEGHILVLEYKDRVLPISVESTAMTASLYRGDIVQVTYNIQRRPQQPMHLLLDGRVDQPVVVMDAIATWHDQPKTLSGHLVKFPQSPQIQFDVYAIEVDTDGIKRTFTLVNFESPEQFQQIQNKLADIWDRHVASVVNGRNCLINPAVTIQVQGIVNVVSPEQANPQILLDGVEALQIMG